MSTPAEQLRGELAAAGWGATPERIAYLSALVKLRGEVEQSHLRAEVGREIWQDTIQRLSAKNPTTAVIQTCGYGALLTEFLVAPLNLAPGERSAAARLGARANLIVSLYDNFLDQGLAPQQILPSHTGGDSSVPAIPALVNGYYAKLPHGPQRPLLERAIRRMYEAENQSTLRQIATLIWRRKSALPWVVLGLGGWVLGNRSDTAHLLWMYRFGSFLGWIDDAADYTRDIAKGRPNRFQEAAPDTIPRVVRLGNRVLDWWDARASSTDRAALPDSRDAFRYCVSSWIASRPR